MFSHHATSRNIKILNDGPQTRVSYPKKNKVSFLGGEAVGT